MWMRTWAVIHKALSRSEVSAQLKNNLTHVIEQNKSTMYDNQVNQISYVGPPPKPDYFCMDQIRKFHYS